MKKFTPGIVTVLFLAIAFALSGSESAVQKGGSDDPEGIRAPDKDQEKKHPWTSLKVNHSPDQFQFAVIADRTGGERERVFSRAIAQINLLQPHFVMSVGDLIEGFDTNPGNIKGMWNEFDGFVKKLEMPFFYVPGNHDLCNQVQMDIWKARYGKRTYHFVYKNVLFLCINMEDMNSGVISKDDQNEVQKILQAENKVRWTFVFTHRPVWNQNNLAKIGWAAVEKALAGRNYTVFVGHVHSYRLYERNGMQYYQLATTAGESLVRGMDFREFDHIAWVTMKNDKPVVAQVMLNGITGGDLKLPEGKESVGVQFEKKKTHPVEGKLTIDGKEPKDVGGLTITLHAINKKNAPPDRTGEPITPDGLTDSKGRFLLSTYRRFDGCSTGEFVVTVMRTGKSYYDWEETDRPQVPEKYHKPNTSPLRVTIKEGTNEIKLDVSSK